MNKYYTVGTLFKVDGGWLSPDGRRDVYLASEADAELDTMNLAVGYFHEENDRFITRITELEKALGNCRLLAMKRLHKGAVEQVDWEAILRFCTEAGCGPSPLRADS